MDKTQHTSNHGAKNIHFIGIGGIGMSALAQLYAHEGEVVRGSDRSITVQVRELLVNKGIEVFDGHAAEHVAEDTDLVVYSHAVPADNPERMRAAGLGIKELSYFEALGEVTKGRFAVVISGTHGKTTTTGMLTKILVDAGLKPTAIVGSIMKDFGSNFVPGDPNLFVVEGCEYKRHFTNFAPNIFVITNLELDHTDYYPDLASMQAAFKEVVGKIPHEGALVTNPALPGLAPAIADFSGTLIDYVQEDVAGLRLPGEHNVWNAQAAKAAAKQIALAKGVDLADSVINASLAAFEGTWRRFEYKGKTPFGAEVFDDYAHHPTAISVTIRAAREKFPGKKIAALFQPHTYSRTKSFFHEFAIALAAADECILLLVFAAREELDPSVSSERLAEEVVKEKGEAKAVETLDDAYDALRGKNSDWVILSLGAGEQYKVAERLVEEK